MTTIYLVRHAHSTYTPEERKRPLSDKGRKEAEKICEVLQSYPVDVIVSSPYQRAIETVSPLAERLHKKIDLIEEMRERTLMKGGANDFNQAIQAVWEDETFAWPGGESNRMARNRGVQAIEGILNRYQGQQVVVGTHGNIMALIMGAYDNSYGFQFWKSLSMPDVYALSFEGKRLIHVKRVKR